MNAPRAPSALHRRLTTLLESRLGIDTRALAAFRIGLGTLLIADLLLRARNLTRFYTDDGALPVSVLAEQTPILAKVSLHAQSGAAWFQIVLFTVAIVVALALVVGYRTRIATALSLLLLLSLHARNPHVLSGGDALLEHLLFWSLLLPLGERWSVDAHHRGQTHRERIVGVASAAILVQVLLVYGVNAVVKFQSDVWMAGDAVAVVLGVDRLTVLLGPLLRDVPLALQVVNWTWIGLLVLSPLLVLTTGRVRTLLVATFAGMHAGMLLTMHLGIFPLVSTVALVPFLPPWFWNRVTVTRVMEHVRARTTRLHTALASRRPRWSPDRPSLLRSRSWRRVTRTVVAVVLVGLVVYNAIAVGIVPVPAPVDDGVEEKYVDSRWTLFALDHTPQDRWYVAPAERSAGERVDAFHGPTLRWDRPPDVAATYSSSRARKFMSNLRYDEALQSSFARYLCERWHRDHDDELVTVDLYVVEAPSLAVAGDGRDRTQLVSTSC